MTDLALYVSLTLVAVTGAAVALIRDPVRQALVSGVFGVTLAISFLLLAAPGVAMAVIVIDVVAVPVLVLATVASVRGSNR